ncbi:MAG TPA: CaiB/BaiF CoA-transferase family protein [Verrucomicrobiae bacterium]|nr:CaiB/BaiF CoA-transferase family protein [Verrucomicrobiae bacterium]
MTEQTSTGPLSGIRVFDLSRILAGPTCTQLLGDLGAEVIKIERPGAGDDTRKWGPPYLKGKDGKDTDEAAYYLSSNRNKRSVTVDISKPEGQALAKKLIAKCDIMIENFKVGDMARYGLSHADLKDSNPRLVYCSISGFGQTGPYAPRAGYDLLAQGIGGIMSITGEPDRPPMKVGVGIADVMCGMYATVAILGALHHRDKTGVGQYIDLALLDSQVAWLINVGLNYLTSGNVPQRVGNEHPNIVPYNVLPASDGFIILAVGNDAQYQKFCGFAGAPELAKDPRFLTNADRVRNRREIYELLPAVTRRKKQAEWIDGLAKLGVPCSPVNNVDQVFEDPQVQQREMKITMPHPLSASGTVDLIGNPIKFSETPVDYRLPPPYCGQHTQDVLGDLLQMSNAEIEALRQRGVV